MQKLKRYK